MTAAKDAYDFVLFELYPDSDRPLRRVWNGKPQHEAVAEDYANLVAAALALWEATASDFAISMQWREVRWLEGGFTAPNGAFFQTGNDASDVPVRSSSVYDNAVPPANATMLANYARLQTHFGPSFDKFEIAKRAEAIVRAFSGTALEAPTGTASFLNAFELLVSPLSVSILAPDAADSDFIPDEAPALAAVAWRNPNPNTICNWVFGEGVHVEGHPAHGKVAIGGKPTAYVCRGQVCSAPVTDPVALAELLAR